MRIAVGLFLMVTPIWLLLAVVISEVGVFAIVPFLICAGVIGLMLLGAHLAFTDK